MPNKTTILEELKKSKALLGELGFYFANEVKDEELRELERLHDIDNDEDILLLMDRRLKISILSIVFTELFTDTEFTDETSVILTTERLSVEQRYKVYYQCSWSEIEAVEYKSAKLIFYYDDEKSSYDYVEVEYFKESDDLEISSQDLKAFAALLGRIAAMFENTKLRTAKEEQQMYEKIETAFAKHKVESFFSLSEEYFSIYGDDGQYALLVLYMRAELFFKQKKYEEALSELDTILSYFVEAGEETENENEEEDEHEEEEEMPAQLQPEWDKFYQLRALILKEKAECYQALQSLSQGLQYASDRSSRKALEKLFQETYEAYVESFKDLQYEKRKAVVVTDEIGYYVPSQFHLFHIKKMPEINFSSSLLKNEVHVAHPCFSDLYMPLRNYEYEIFYDKISEYLYFLQCLGAKEIRIQVLKGEEIEELKKHRWRLKAGASVKVHSGEAGGEATTETSKSLASSVKIDRLQKFSPTKKPYLPEGLAWYKREPSWQRLYQQRLSGSILEFREKISTSKNEALSQHELMEIEVEYKNFLFSLGLKFSNEIQTLFKKKKETEWEVSVVFAPISELYEEHKPAFEVKDTTAHISTTTLSPQELEYLEMYEEAFEDFTVTDDEMRMLERRRQKLGISEERAKELAEMVIAKQSFAKEEQEYMEEYKYCLENDQEISPDERRMLDKLGKKLNIASERMRQLEELVLRQVKGEQP